MSPKPQTCSLCGKEDGIPYDEDGSLIKLRLKFYNSWRADSGEPTACRLLTFCPMHTALFLDWLEEFNFNESS